MDESEIGLWNRGDLELSRQSNRAERHNSTEPKTGHHDFTTDEVSTYIQRPVDEKDTRSVKAYHRNIERIERANKSDEDTIGKYLPGSIGQFFPFRWAGPEDRIDGNDDWLEEVIEVARTPCPTPAKPSFMFATTEQARNSNAQILKNCGYDLETALQEQRGSTVWHGSEFRPVGQLSRFLRTHPNFDYLSKIFENGMDYEFDDELSELERINELSAQLQRGNHQSANMEAERIGELLAKDVRHGFCLPLPVEEVTKIKGSMVQPCGIVTQHTLTASGERAKKKRLTHDLSFNITEPGRSVNDRIDMDKYPEMVYGWCLSRIIHYTVELRHKFPNEPIFVSKFDYSDAYRRISHTAKAAAMTILVVGSVAFLMLRLAFGGSPNPPCFCAFSETLTDLANELSASSYVPSMFRSPTVKAHHLEPKDYPVEGEAFGVAIAPAVEVPITGTARKDAFIDDIVSVFLGTQENLEREGDIVPLAVHVMSRPHAGDDNEPIPRRQLLQPDKLEEEARPSEIEVVLGWLLDTRRLLIALPDDKYKAWVQDLDDILESTTVSFHALESLIGRLNHASFVIPLSRHFLNELRWRLEHRQKLKRASFRLSFSELEDLRLWRMFLAESNKGMSLNLLTVRTPTHIAWSDSCPYGLGGYLLTGQAWRIRIPKEASFYGADEANNVLEFLGMGINILLLIHFTKPGTFPCFLALGDNTSAIAWIFKSGKVSKHSPYYYSVKLIARKIASAVIETRAQLSSQHLPGRFNDVSDLLSFSGEARGYTNPLTRDEPDNKSLTQRIRLHLPQLVPQNFEIVPLPKEITSFAIIVLRTFESSWNRNRKKAGRNKTAPGDGGSISSTTLDYWTPSCLEYPETCNSSSPELLSSDIDSLTSSRMETLVRNVRGPWYQRLSKLPSAMWLRRSGQITARVPSTTRGEA